RLGDLLGRKRVYQYDLLVYSIGILLMAFSVHTAMLVTGAFIVGVAVGADVPTSLALVGELAPSRARGKLIGFTQVYWSMGPIIAGLVFTAVVYTFWNLAAGTYGIFLPFILSTVAGKSQAVSVALQLSGFVITAVLSVLLFMRYADRGHGHRQAMWAAGAASQ